MGTSTATSFSRTSDAAYRAAYINYRFQNADHFFASDNSTSLNAAPTDHSFTYTWSLSGIDSEYAEINSNTGAVNYKKSTSGNVNATVTLTATSTSDNSVVLTATQSVTFKPVTDPTSISITSGNSMTVNVGNTGNITYSLTPDLCHDNVTFSSSNTGVAIVGTDGTVTGVAAGQTTITVTAKKIDGTTTTALTATVTVTVKDKVATPEISFAPTAADNGATATATITCSTSGTAIYYTINGSDPTTSSTQYNGTFTVNDGDVVRAIAVKSPADANWDDSDVSTKTYTPCETTAPSITYTVSGSTATVTITAETDATIYYTTNGSEPTTSSSSGTTTVTINGVSSGATIKAYAKHGNCRASDVVTKEIITSGTSGTVVTLYDYEDHKWSYYSDPDCPVRSLNPADVKITYYGDGIVMTGNNDYTASSTDFVKRGQTGYTGGAKVNVGGENENTFVYYKTLERTDGSTSANPTGRCPYKPIPNPFQVRPTYGTPPNSNRADWTGWRGFQCWRLKSVTGGAVYAAASGGTALSTGAVINAETEIYFAPNAEYGMEVQLEAVWSIAYLVYANADGGWSVPNHASLGYERNFVVLASNKDFYFRVGGDAYITGIDRPSTITPYLPNGTSGNSQIGRVRGENNNNATYQNITLQANTKFENIQFTYMGERTITAANHDLIIGRGCSGTVNYVRGVNANVTSPSYTIRIESGTINYLSYIRGYSTTEGTATDVPNYQAYTVGGTPNVKGVLGCDYDRATNSGITNNLIINNGVYYAYSVSEATGIVYSENALNVHVKSGKIGNSFTINNNYTADASQAFYIGVAGQRVRGHRKLFLEGGEVASIAGGIDATQNQDNNSVSIRMTGGHVRGAVYGGAARSAAYGNRNLIVTGGSITGWIGGGCNGEAYPQGQTSEDTYGGITNGAARVYFGGNATCGGTGSNVNINGSQGGIVFGAGKGVEGNTTSGRMSQGTTVVVADACDIERNVYGGGNFGYAQTSTDVFVSGGTVHGSVFGGSNQNNGPVIDIEMKGGTIESGLYGGSNTTGTITGNVTMNINGGQVGTSSKTANIHGGGYGQNTAVNGDVRLTLGVRNQTTPGVTVYGDVYGGSADGSVNNAATDSTVVTLNAGTINGSLYGGGLGISNNECNVNGAVKVTVNGGSVIDPDGAEGNPASVFGCNNAKGSPKSTVDVIVNGTDPNVTTVPTVYYKAGDEIPSGKDVGDVKTAGVYAINGVYGGGNLAHYNPDQVNNAYPTPTVTINGCETSIKDVYGGGNAAAVTATDVTVNGGIIGRVFAGGNGESGTPAHVGYMNTDANPTGTGYGAGTAAAKIYGGTIGQVFGGSNKTGVIRGSSSINIAKSTAQGACPMIIGEVYRGGNEAPGALASLSIGCTGTLTDAHSDTPEEIGQTLEGIGELYGGSRKANNTDNAGVVLNITSGMIRRVFGGNNISGTLNGTIQVNVVQDTSKGCGWYVGDVFGGGNLATYTGSPAVNILNGTVSGNVYGGGAGMLVDGTNRGAAGKVTGNPAVTIGDSDANHTAIVLGDVYGGGDAADVAGTPTIEVNDCDTEIGYLYGGGNAADVSGSTITFNAGTVHNDAFGGGHGDKDASNPSKYADVKGDVTFNVYGGTIGRLFAGSNSRGEIQGTSSLTINKTGDCAMKIGEVYGGGNEAAGVASSINIQCTGTLVPLGDGEHYGYDQEGIGYVYGGANQADIGTSESPSNIVVNIKSGIVGNVFGGNNQSGNIYGSIEVNIEKNNSAACASNWYVGNVYGGGNLAQYSIYGYNTDGTVKTSGDNPYTDPKVNIKNGTVSGSVFGAGKGDASATGEQDGVRGSVTGNPVVTIGDATAGYQATVTGDVYGGGEAANVNGNTWIKYQKADNSAAKLFGGGKAANVTGTATIDLLAGSVTAGVYGGCNDSGTIGGAIAVNITGGTVGADGTPANVHGGGYGASTATSSDVTVNIGARTGTSPNFSYSGNATIYGDVYGGSALGNVNASTSNSTNVNLYDGTINGSLYGGGLGDANNAALVNGAVNVEVDGGTVTGAVFGCNNVSGTPKGQVTVTINGTDTPASGYALGEVYGGGNMANYVPADGIVTSTNYSPKVIVNGCDNSIGYIYGGGNAADVPSTDVTIWGGYIGQVFGGGHGNKDANPATEANVNGNVAVKIYGGTIGQVFGGSNSKGTISGEVDVTVNKQGTCAMKIGEVYGGGNLAAGNAGTVTIGCTGAIVTGDNGHAAHPENIGTTLEGIGTVFGGANNADIGTSSNHSDITLNINSGMVANVFGGNNNGGDIYGTITVNINKNAETCGWYVGNVFGGGNQAVYTAPTGSTNYPAVNILNGEVSGDVFGGGYGHETDKTKGVVNGNPQVTVNGANASVVGGVYGGGSLAPTVGNPVVTLTNGSTTNIYGGGKAAGITGAPTVNINGGSVTDGIYGGCNASGDVSGAITVNINGGTLGVSGTPLTSGIFGGGFGASTTTSGNVTVNVGDASHAPTVYSDIYGGSALGQVNNEATDATTVNILGGTINGNVYGGGLGEAGASNVAKGQVNGAVTVNIGSVSGSGSSATYSGAATINGSVFGCNNTNGSPQADVTVNIYGTGHTTANSVPDTPSDGWTAAALATNSETQGYAIEAVYGGGNLAAYTPAAVTSGDPHSATVHVYGCENTIEDVYGGGNAADVGTNSIEANTNVIVEGGRIKHLFGGGNGAGNTNPGANIFGTASTTLYAGLIDQVFGGSNEKGSITKVELVLAYDANIGCDKYYGEVFGGGNMAQIDGNLITTIQCGAGTFGDFYGGANAANITGHVTLNIYGGTYNNVYGGSKGDLASLNVNGETGHENVAANIGGNVTLNLFGGKMTNAFGGSNLNGNIAGSITVNMLDLGATNCGLSVNNVYGASNLAAYTPTDASAVSPVVNIIHGRVSKKSGGDGLDGNVFGGGKGASALVTANPKVNIGYAAVGETAVNALSLLNGYTLPSTYTALVDGNVYGGGDAAAVTGNATVIYNDANASSTVAKLFGGGNAASVSGTTSVTLTNGKVTAGVYGGCNFTGSVGAVTVALNGGTVGASGATADVYGGGYGSATTTTGNVGVTLNGTTVYGDIYGGSALGKVNSPTASPANMTTVTITGTNLHGSVFGGGKGDANTQAVSNGDATVNINAANAYTGIYGGANVNGLVSGNIILNINANIGTSGDGNGLEVFGGGFGALTETDGNVTVNVGDGSNAPIIYGAIYGGSALGQVNDADTDKTTVNVLSGTIHGNVYGGGLGEANVYTGETLTTDNSAKGQVNGTVKVNIGATDGESTPTYSGSATIDGSVYGCNNTNGSPKADVTVNVYQTAHNTTNTATYIENDGTNGNPTYAIGQIFGGGNQAAYSPATVASGDPHSATVHVYTCLNTVETIYGGGNAADATDVNVIIDGGRFDRVFGGGNGYSETGNHTNPNAANYNPGADITGSATTQIRGGHFRQVFGGSNQYGDVANASLSIDPEAGSGCGLYIDESFGGANEAEITGNVTTTLACTGNSTATIGSFYGGSNLADIDGSVTLNVYGGSYTNVFGGSKGRLADNSVSPAITAKAANITGDVTLNLYGGTMENAFGGSDVNGNINGKITVNMLDLGGSCPLTVNNIYGGGRDAAYTPTTADAYPEVNILHGTVTKKAVTENNTTTYTGGNVFGGGLGATAIVTSNPVVRIGYDATTMSGLLPTTLPTGYSLPTTYTATIAGDVYGGGDAAAVSGNTTILYHKANNSAAKLFGGGNAAGVSGTATVNLSAGTVTAGVYGGCNASGTVGGAIAVNVTGGTVGANGTGNEANVHGGGYGSATGTGGNVTVTVGDGTTTPVIYGDVYGGSALGNVNDATAQTPQTTKVWLKSGTVNGSLYGGGLGQLAAAAVGTQGDPDYIPAKEAIAAMVNGAVQVVVDGGTVNTTANTARTSGAVFGCNNVNGTPKGTVAVVINSTAATVVDAQGTKTYALQGVYGGGNLAHYDPTDPNNNPTVTVNGCATSIKDVFGGGNAAAVTATDVTINGGDIDRVFAGGNGTVGPAHVGYKTTVNPPTTDSYGTGATNATITGGTIKQVFGGSNTSGVVRGTGTLSIAKSGDSGACDMHITEVYGGGNLAAGNAASISIGCTGGSDEGIGDVYGGANQADVGNNIALTISGGSIQRVFGGNNTSGDITGSITVNVNWATGNDACGYNYLGSVFGGGNLAAYEGTPAVTITNGTVSHSVYGGGNEAGVGGGNVSMVGGTVLEGIYGGCNTSGTVTGAIVVNVTGGTVGTDATHTANVHGGGYGKDTETEGNVTVNIGARTGTSPNFSYSGNATIYGDVYGGSALGSVNGSSNTTAVNLYAGTINGSLYGGGLGQKPGVNGAANDATAIAAMVNGAVTVEIDGGTVTGAVYGANNVNGSPQGAVAVVVNGTNAHTPAVGTEGETGYTPAVFAVSAVYGGGNLADCAASTSVTVNDCAASIQDVFGGGNAAAVAATSVTINGGIIDRVFAGGNGEVSAANVTGAASAIVHGGTIRQLFGGGNKSGSIGSMSVLVDKQGSCDESIAEVYGGGNEAPSGPGTVTIACGAEHIGDVFGGANNATIDGNIVLNINGGQINRVFGGNNNGGNITGSITVNIDTHPTGSSECTTFSLNNVYGGGNLAAYTPTTPGSYPQVNIIKGTVSGNVFGGGLGSTAIVTSNPEVNIKGGTVAGNVFGGGEEAGVTGSVAVNVTSGAVQGDLYGGGALANTNTTAGGTTTVNLSGGTVNNVYGGGLGRKAKDAVGTPGDANYQPAVTAVAAIVGGSVTVDLNGNSTSGASNDCDVKGKIFGCNNLNGTPKGHVKVWIHKTVRKDANGQVIATKPTRTDNEMDHPGNYEVEAVYGGGNQASYEPTSDTDFAEVTIDGCEDTSIRYVYGSGNAASTPATKVYVNGGWELGYVFGGGNGKDEIAPGVPNPGADVGKIGSTEYGLGTTDVYVYGGYLHYAFGGSNSLGNVRENATVHLDEAKENNVVICPLHLDEVYGGGNKAYMDGNAAIDLGCIESLSEIYGGARDADINADVVLTITSGHFGRVFGGNNHGGAIGGSITVNIEETGCHPVVIGELYGCGNEAAYSVYGYNADGTIKTSGSNPKVDPTVNVKSFTSIGRIFGGGYGQTATVAGNPKVYVDEVFGDHASEAFAEETINYYGGGSVTLPARAASTSGAIGAIGTVYGGGNAAPVIGNTNVLIGTKETIKYTTDPAAGAGRDVKGVDIRGNVFGAGLGATATVTGNTNVQVGR